MLRPQESTKLPPRPPLLALPALPALPLLPHVDVPLPAVRTVEGDGVQWSFWASNRLELKPPFIKPDERPAGAGVPSPDFDGVTPNMDVSGSNPGYTLGEDVITRATLPFKISINAIPACGRWRSWSANWARTIRRSMKSCGRSGR